MASTYTGPWINWSRGRILGATITLDQRDGGLLTAFLALFVSAAGAATWKITCYILHQSRTAPDSADGLHHQQQAILCNSATPVGASWQLAQLAWYWRKHVVKPVIRTLPLIALALLNFIFFGVASVFSSEVTRGAGNETLIQPTNCGLLNYSSGNWGGVRVASLVGSNYTWAASTYARACYENSYDPLTCSQYAVPNLSWTTNRNATCPFASEICLYGDEPAAYEMDTGLLDSHHHLGINAPEVNRLQLRKVTTCSPIQTKGFADRYNVTDPANQAFGDMLERYMYGGSASTNYTWQYNTHGATVDSYGYSLW